MTDYRDTPAARPALAELRPGDVLTPKQAEAFSLAEIHAQGLRLDYDGDGMGGTAVNVLAMLPEPRTYYSARDAEGGRTLTRATYREPEGLRLTGDGTLQHPLTAVVQPGFALVRVKAGDKSATLSGDLSLLCMALEVAAEKFDQNAETCGAEFSDLGDVFRKQAADARALLAQAIEARDA